MTANTADRSPVRAVGDRSKATRAESTPGTGQNTVKLKYVIKNDDIEIGDKLVTSGKDGIYPKGIPAGIVITANKNKAGIFADIDVMPFNNFRQLDEVLLVKK